jgi:hypothetical protein
MDVKCPGIKYRLNQTKKGVKDERTRMGCNDRGNYRNFKDKSG